MSYNYFQTSTAAKNENFIIPRLLLGRDGSSKLKLGHIKTRRKCPQEPASCNVSNVNGEKYAIRYQNIRECPFWLIIQRQENHKYDKLEKCLWSVVCNKAIINSPAIYSLPFLPQYIQHQLTCRVEVERPTNIPLPYTEFLIPPFSQNGGPILINCDIVVS